jgi:transposase InsO family protein
MLKTKEYRAGFFLLTVCRRRRRAQKRREGAGVGTWQRRRIGRRSGERGVAPTGVEDGNLQQHELDKPLAIPRIKKKVWRNQSFTGDDEFTTAAGTRGGGAEENRCLSACVGVLRVQREVQELECEFK